MTGPGLVAALLLVLLAGVWIGWTFGHADAVLRELEDGER